MVSSIAATTVTFGGCAIVIRPGGVAWNQHERRTGNKPSGACASGFRPETITPWLPFARVNKLLSGNGPDFFLAHYSQPPIRAQKTHEANECALKSLRPVFAPMKLTEIGVAQIELHLRRRLQQHKRVRRRSGVVELGLLKPTTVHQEFRVLRRILSVAVKKNLCPAKPLRWRGVSGDPERFLPAPLHVLVRTAENRAACSRLSQEHHSDHHGNGAPGL